jgi:hypothetical protein
MEHKALALTSVSFLGGLLTFGGGVLGMVGGSMVVLSNAISIYNLCLQKKSGAIVEDCEDGET